MKNWLIMTMALCVFVVPDVWGDTAKVEVLVVDEATGAPLEGVGVTGYFTVDIGWRAWTESSIPNEASAVTDANGRCRISGKTNCGEVGCWVENPPAGYYLPLHGWGHTYEEKNFFGVWQPDDLVATIRLQRVENPIPLWVKGSRLDMGPEQAAGFDGTNAVWRYDLVMGDWLPPAGKGEVADLVIAGSYRIVERAQGGSFDFDCFEYAHVAEFPGEGNGVLEILAAPSMGIKVRQAPEIGYGPSAKGAFGRTKSLYGIQISPKLYSDEDPNRCYVFRIRSRHDEQGNLVEAYYGKIYGDFSFQRLWHVGGNQPVFLYYLNPKPLDRNLEWDMKTNLCPDPGTLNNPQP